MIPTVNQCPVNRLWLFDKTILKLKLEDISDNIKVTNDNGQMIFHKMVTYAALQGPRDLTAHRRRKQNKTYLISIFLDTDVTISSVF